MDRATFEAALTRHAEQGREHVAGRPRPDAGAERGDGDGAGEPGEPDPDRRHLLRRERRDRATVQHLLGIDYKKNTFPYEGRDESLVGVNPARVLTDLFA